MCGCVLVAASCVAFNLASGFNGDVSLWDTSSVTSMAGSKWLCVVVVGDGWGVGVKGGCMYYRQEVWGCWYLMNVV